MPGGKAIIKYVNVRNIYGYSAGTVSLATQPVSVVLYLKTTVLQDEVEFFYPILKVRPILTLKLHTM